MRGRTQRVRPAPRIRWGQRRGAKSQGCGGATQPMYAIRRWKDVRRRITARAISASGGWPGVEGCRGMERSDGWKVRWVERRDARSLARFRAQQRGFTGRLFHGRERNRRHGSRKRSGLTQRKNRREGPPISPTDLGNGQTIIRLMRRSSEDHLRNQRDEIVSLMSRFAICHPGPGEVRNIGGSREARRNRLSEPEHSLTDN